MNRDQITERVRQIKCWLLDMDGTVSLGEEALPGAAKFFANLGDCDFIFLTNNSSHRADYYIRRMAKLGFPVLRHQMLTSTDALILFLKENHSGPGPVRLYPVGTPDFEAELTEAGFNLIHERGQTVDFVVLGFDTTLTYEKVDIACDYIRQGLPWLAANPDKVCPLPGGKVLPDCGALIAFMETCTDTHPLRIIGKPETVMVDMVLNSRGYERQQLAMVGDRVYTDIAVAVNAGIMSVAVLSGEATLQDIAASGLSPDLILPGIGDLVPFLTGEPIS